MTQKDFGAIAKALHSVKPDGYADLSAIRDDQWWMCVTKIADALAETNPRFNRLRFYGTAEGLQDDYQ
jgi:hypothetical protein